MAREHGATLWTQDVDYQGLPGVHYSAKPMARFTSPLEFGHIDTAYVDRSLAASNTLRLGLNQTMGMRSLAAAMRTVFYTSATQLPDLAPCFSSTFTSVMTMPRSMALHMS